MNDLLTQCLDIYDTLMSIYDIRKDIGYQDAVRKMVSTVGGSCRIKAYRTRIGDSDCMEIDWRINSSGYDGYNMILDDNFNKWVRFIEDLTMAYYSSNGGTGYNTYELMEAIGK
jgi:hypothetical protein